MENQSYIVILIILCLLKIIELTNTQVVSAGLIGEFEITSTVEFILFIYNSNFIKKVC